MPETSQSNHSEESSKTRKSLKFSIMRSSITSLLRTGQESTLRTYTILTWPRELFIVVNKTTAILSADVSRGTAVTLWTRKLGASSSTYVERPLLSIKLPMVRKTLCISLTYGRLRSLSYIRMGLKRLPSSKTK